MKKLMLSLVLAVTVALSTTAYADSSYDEGASVVNSNTAFGSGQGIGHGGTSNATSNATGGAGGNGGRGGTGYGIGLGGNALANGGSALANGGTASANGGNSNVLNNIRNTQSQGQGQSQDQLQGQGQGQSQSTDNANNAAQTTNVTVQGSTYEAQKRNPVSSAYAASNFPTAPCMGSSSVGGSGVLFSFSGGTSWESKECMLLETARSFEQAGYREDALHIRCDGKYAKSAPSCIALKEGK